MHKIAEKSSLTEKESSFNGKNRVLSFLVKSSFPQKAQKKPESKAKFIPILIEIETSKNVFNTDQPLGKKGLGKIKG